MQIGELAKWADVTVQTIRFYERLKVLPEPQRKDSGYRVYSEPDLKRLLFVRQAKSLGFSLTGIAPAGKSSRSLGDTCVMLSSRYEPCQSSELV